MGAWTMFVSWGQVGGGRTTRRKVVPAERMLRMYLPQLWFCLSDERRGGLRGSLRDGRLPWGGSCRRRVDPGVARRRPTWARPYPP